MNEKQHAALKQRTAFRLAENLLLALGIMLFSLAIGMLGYHQLEGMGWRDAFLNAAMLLGGMGPVDKLTDDDAKLFAGIYAMYCGVVFIATTGLLMAPVGGYVLHRFHLEKPE